MNDLNNEKTMNDLKKQLDEMGSSEDGDSNDD